jgi:hypothetical protein
MLHSLFLEFALLCNIVMRHSGRVNQFVGNRGARSVLKGPPAGDICKSNGLCGRKSVGGQGTIIRQSSDFCSVCGEGIFSRDESEQYLATVSSFWANAATEPQVPTEVRRIRKKLGLSQREAGEIFDGGIRAFSR